MSNKPWACFCSQRIDITFVAKFGWVGRMIQIKPHVYLVGAAVIIRSCHNGNKGTAENERLRDLKFIFSYPKNERLIFLYSRNAAQKEISTMRVG